MFHLTVIDGSYNSLFSVKRFGVGSDLVRINLSIITCVRCLGVKIGSLSVSGSYSITVGYHVCVDRPVRNR